MIQKNSIKMLEEKLSCKWDAIQTACIDAEKTRERISSAIIDGIQTKTLFPAEEASIVVFGSLARNEWTQGSDVDWTFLIDGPADPEHRDLTHIISRQLEKEGLRRPGPTGVFGNMAFSHDIIHQIGGQRDTNQNTTQRILLLLESRAIGSNIVHDRVIRSVLGRYLDDDTSLLSPGGKEYKIPRFLLNDIVRYWRTMAVDYAYKRYERAGQGWALRNIKLRMSRKLIFTSGLLICFSCYPRLSEINSFKNPLPPNTIEHLMKYIKMPPLEVVSEVLYHYASKETARQIMQSYNDFLCRISSVDIRNHLDNLDISLADSDTHFKDMCEISRNFQQGLTKFFFDENEQIRQLIRKYGVF